MTCRCYSSNEPEDSQAFKCAVRTPEQFGGKFIEIDFCIAEHILRLWENGIWTGGCCCGHGTARPSVVLASPEDVHRAAIGLPPGWDICYWLDGKLMGLLHWCEKCTADQHDYPHRAVSNGLCLFHGGKL